MNEKPKNSTSKNTWENYEIYGKYTCKEDSSLKLEVSRGPKVIEISFSDGAITELQNVWGIQGIDKIIDPGIWNEVIADLEVTPRTLHGDYTFHAAITEHDTINVLGVDSVTITIE